MVSISQEPSSGRARPPSPGPAAGSSIKGLEVAEPGACPADGFPSFEEHPFYPRAPIEQTQE